MSRNPSSCGRSIHFLVHVRRRLEDLSAVESDQRHGAGAQLSLREGEIPVQLDGSAGRRRDAAPLEALPQDDRSSLGEILGQAYVRKNFTPEAKARALEMVRNIQAEFRSRLGNVTWMSQETKSKAYAKLDSIINKIGYPDRWRDYSSLESAAVLSSPISCWPTGSKPNGD